MSEAEELLAKLESRNRTFRGAFCLALAALATIVVATLNQSVPTVIRTRAMNVLADSGVVAVVGTQNTKVVFGTTKGSASLVSAGEGLTGGGVLVVSGATGKDVIRLATTKSAGGSVSINGPDGREIANASPNVTNAGSLFIDNAASTLIGEINGDKKNGGAIITHNAQGTETSRVRQQAPQ